MNKSERVREKKIGGYFLPPSLRPSFPEWTFRLSRRIFSRWETGNEPDPMEHLGQGSATGAATAAAATAAAATAAAAAASSAHLYRRYS